MFRNMDAELQKKKDARLETLQLEIGDDELFGVKRVKEILSVGHHTAQKTIEEGLESSIFVKSTNKPWLVQLN